MRGGELPTQSCKFLAVDALFNPSFRLEVSCYMHRGQSHKLRVRLCISDADLLKNRAENATSNGILIGSVVMTEICARSRNCIKRTN